MVLVLRKEVHQQNQGIAESDNRGRGGYQRELLKEGRGGGQSRNGRRVAGEIAAAYTRVIVELHRGRISSGLRRGAIATRQRPIFRQRTQRQEVFLVCDRS